MKVIKKLLIGFILVGAVSACADDETTASPVVKKVTVSISDVSMNKSNNVYANVPTQLKAMITYSDDSEVDGTTFVAWSSDNDSILTVSTTGIVMQPATFESGTENIIATFGLDTDGNQVEGTIPMTADNTAVDSVIITPADPILIKDIPQQLVATAKYGTATDAPIVNATTLADWASVDMNKVTVDNVTMKGKITYVANGTTDVTAIFGDKDGTVSVVTTDAVLQSIKVTVDPTQGTDNIPKGIDKRLVAMGTYSEGNPQNITTIVTWISSADTVIKVYNDTRKGLATAEAGMGTSDITAKFGTVTSIAKQLTAVPAVLGSIKITYPDIVGTGTSTPVLVGVDSDGTPSITTPSADLFNWSIPDEDVVTIDTGNGVVTSVTNGEKRVTAKLRDKGDLPWIFIDTGLVTVTGI